MKTVYIVGSKGIPAKYGGFETFVEKLTEYHQNRKIRYYIACMSDNSLKSGITQSNFEYNGANCFNIDVPNIGPARAVYYDIVALHKAIEMAKENQDEAPIFYVLACRIGPFIGMLKKKIQQLNGTLIVNPDGHEWLRKKWSFPIRKYWKLSERLMVKHADFLVCDSKNIETYIQKEYSNYHPRTQFIAYGTDLYPSEYRSDSPQVREWYTANHIHENDYYLIVGRFVPENNFETMIKEFMKSSSKKSLVIITDHIGNGFYDRLKNEIEFDKDDRIRFVGTVYEPELLKYIRENAFAYLHGHEVGGTNPSLLEALGSTQLNLLLQVGFNKEVAEEGALYWNKENLHQLIEQCEYLSDEEKLRLGALSRERLTSYYNWDGIIQQYEGLFLSEDLQ